MLGLRPSGAHVKRLHRQDLYCWSTFDERRDIDFNSVLWVHRDGNVLIDPLPLTPHDFAHLRSLGGAGWIALTNSDHVRGAATIAADNILYRFRMVALVWLMR